jgi:D-alanyl-D-alanine carboxypeptidase (penicillin-binding protein 5/6)
MSHGSSAPAGTSQHRSTSTSRLGRVLLVSVAAVILVHTALAGAGRLSGETGGPPGGGELRVRGRHAHRGGLSWPQRGQAALVLGNDRPAASPHQQPAAIASLAKVMTAYLTLQRYPLDGEEDGFTITVTAAQAQAEAEDAARGQSVVPVRAGEQLTERQLLEALLIPSGNNVASMLSELVAGSERRFEASMNAAARVLGMHDTVYTDPSGFDPGTVSTAADQLSVLQAAMRFPLFRQIVSMPAVTLPVAGTVHNFNPLVGAGFAGKTGSDSAAGGCLAFFTEVAVGGRRLTAAGVVMGQGEGSDTSAILGAAGDAAERLVQSAVRGR